MSNAYFEIKVSGRLPSPSGVGMQILRLTQSEDNCLDEIIKVVRSDPSLTGRILKVANCGSLSTAPHATTLEEAVLRLGLQTLRDLVLGFSLVGSNPKALCAGFDYAAFWHESVGRAVAAQHLTELSGSGAGAESYICGLLSGIGRLALATAHPDKYGTLLREPEAGAPESLVAAESKNFGINHRELTEALLLDWGFPKTLASAAAQYQQSTLDAADEARNGAPALMKVLRAADTFLGLPDRAIDAQEPFPETVITEVDKLGISEMQVRAAHTEIRKAWEEMDTLLNVRPSVRPERRTHPVSGNGTPVPITRALEPSSAPAPTPSGAPTLPGHPREPNRLLLFEADDRIAIGMMGWLKAAGYAVERTSNPKETLARILSSFPHIVIAHGRNSDHEAIEVCKALRSFEAGNAIYFLLAVTHSDPKQLLMAFDAGIDDYLPLPCAASTGLLRIRAAQRTLQLRNKIVEQERRLQQNLSELAVANRKLHRAALTDELTQLPNRRFAEETLRDEWNVASVRDEELSLIVGDIDHFKKVNDTYGHLVGDVVLAAVARVLRRELRQSDVACRIGGEEFLIICRDTDQEKALACAERVRAAVASQEIALADSVHRVTISLGVASRRTLAPGVNSVELLLHAADAASYESKRAGRNRVTPAKRTA